MTGTGKKAQEVIILDQISYIHYPIKFQKDKATIQALINFGSKVNAMSPAYAKQLGLRTWKSDVKAQKIDRSSLDTFEMVIIGFQVIDKLGRVRFFQKIFLLVDTTMEVVLKIPFLTFNNANIQFAEKKLT